MSGLNGWHLGERTVHTKLGNNDNISIMRLYQIIHGDLPAEHAKFHTTRLPFMPVTILDSTGRPWGSILAGKGGEPGFIKNSRYNVLSVEAKVWPGDPLLETAKTYGDREMLVAGIGIEFSTRRRNKFAGKIARLERHNETFSMDWMINQALGNCPKYINVRDLVPHPTSPKVAHQQLRLSPLDRLPDSLISFIHASDTVFVGSTYVAPSSEAGKFPSHLGMNQRGGLPGFVRVEPADGRTVVLPDFSGNRFMTTLGNIEASSMASLTFVSFTTGDILYLTGTATNLFGDDANVVMPFQQRLTSVHVDGYSFVEDALPVRQKPGTKVERSPYSPPVRLLAGEIPEGTLLNLSNANKVQAMLKSITLYSSTLGLFVWELVSATQPSSSSPPSAPPQVSIRPGQAAVLDFTPFLGEQEYQHMAPTKPSAVNDDRIRTWTISSTDVWAHQSNSENDKTNVFDLTMREKPGGTVTGALFTLGRKLASEGRKDLMDDMAPLGIKVGLVGISGDFVLPDVTTARAKDANGDVNGLGLEVVGVRQPLLNTITTATTAVQKKRLLWAAGGIGITPFLAMLNALGSSNSPVPVSWDINFILTTREPEVMVPLLEEALWQVKPSQLGGTTNNRVKLVVDVFSQKPIPDIQGAGDGEDKKKGWIKVEMHRHTGRISRAFFDELVKGEEDETIGFADADGYVCGPEEFENVVIGALTVHGVQRGRIHREGFAY